MEKVRKNKKKEENRKEKKRKGKAKFQSTVQWSDKPSHIASF